MTRGVDDQSHCDLLSPAHQQPAGVLWGLAQRPELHTHIHQGVGAVVHAHIHTFTCVGGEGMHTYIHTSVWVGGHAHTHTWLEGACTHTYTLMCGLECWGSCLCDC